MKVRGQRVIPHEERIRANSRVDPATECWNWTGSIRSPQKPYGRLVIGSRSDGTRRSVGAHQLSYMTFVGPIEDGLCVCHRCDNPRCVNPAHLFLGTKKDNADDRDAKGRGTPPPRIPRDEMRHAKLTTAQVAAICRSSEPSSAVAARVGVSASHIRALRRSNRSDAPLVNTSEADEKR